LRAGWASRHAEVCAYSHDWRLSWPAVEEGWRAAGGQFAPPRVGSGAPSRTAGATGLSDEPAFAGERVQVKMQVYDAFGEPVGQVKVVRARDFLLGRWPARALYVPFSAVRTCGEAWVRLDLPAAQLGAQGWQRSGLFRRWRTRSPAPRSDAAATASSDPARHSAAATLSHS
jgi:hypothetical protein